MANCANANLAVCHVLLLLLIFHLSILTAVVLAPEIQQPQQQQKELPKLDVPNKSINENQIESKAKEKTAKECASRERHNMETQRAGIGRILVTLSPDAKSHARSLLPLVNRLALAGHQMHVFHIISRPETTFNGIPNVTLLEVPIVRGMDQITAQMGKVVWSSTMHAPQLALPYHLMCQTVADALKNNSDKIAQVLNSQWDLVLTSELFNPHGYGFSLLLHEQLHVPLVTYSSTRLMNSHAYYKAIGQSWVTHLHPLSPAPAHAHEGFEPTRFMHRFINVLESVGELATDVLLENAIVGPKVAMITGKRDFTFRQLYSKAEMSLVDGITLLGLPQPSVQDILNIGAHCEPASELPKEYKDFVEDPTSKGTIYVAFGTWTPWDYAPPGLVTAFFDAFERLPQYRILFSFRGKRPARPISAHIRLVDWAPQMDVLSHPKTRVFLTHCGLKSIKESLCSKTPILGMPIFAEQNYNARLMITYGTGIALNKFYVDTDQLYAGLVELLENRKYAERVAKMQRIFLDRPISALDESEFHVRKFIRKGKELLGKHNFKRKGVDMHFVEFFAFDLVFLILLLVFSITK